MTYLPYYDRSKFCIDFKEMMLKSASFTELSADWADNSVCNILGIIIYSRCIPSIP